jgi:transcriptional regulator with XRE-family HTH domain
MTLGTKLLRLRESKTMTREQVAIQIDITKVAYGRWESDLCKPKMDNLIRLCLFYNLSVEELLTDVTNIDSLTNLGHSNRFVNHDKDDITKDECNINILIKNQNEILRLVKLQERLLAGLSYQRII